MLTTSSGLESTLKPVPVPELDVGADEDEDDDVGFGFAVGRALPQLEPVHRDAVDVPLVAPPA